MLRTVTVKMYDELNEVNVERTICRSNIMVADENAALGWECQVIGTNEQIKRLLNEWIRERANEQHDTILTLKSWTVNK